MTGAEEGTSVAAARTSKRMVPARRRAVRVCRDISYIVTEHPMARLPQLLDTLEAHYGPQTPGWPTDPYLFLVWWHCGYPASDVSCAKGWDSLTRLIGLDPDRLLAASPA